MALISTRSHFGSANVVPQEGEDMAKKFTTTARVFRTPEGDLTLTNEVNGSSLVYSIGKIVTDPDHIEQITTLDAGGYPNKGKRKSGENKDAGKSDESKEVTSPKDADGNDPIDAIEFSRSRADLVTLAAEEGAEHPAKATKREIAAAIWKLRTARVAERLEAEAAEEAARQEAEANKTKDADPDA